MHIPYVSRLALFKRRWLCGSIFVLILIPSFVSPVIADTGAQFVAQLPVSNLGTQGITRLTYAPGRPNDVFATRLDGTILRVDLTTNSVSTFATIPNVSTQAASGMFGMLG